MGEVYRGFVVAGGEPAGALGLLVDVVHTLGVDDTGFLGAAPDQRQRVATGIVAGALRPAGAIKLSCGRVGLRGDRPRGCGPCPRSRGNDQAPR